jgi:hypothetical protein
MIEIVEGFWIDPWDVKVIKKIDETSCSLWISGQAATEGFVIPYPPEDVVQAVIDAREESEEEIEDE